MILENKQTNDVDVCHDYNYYYLSEMRKNKVACFHSLKDKPL